MSGIPECIAIAWYFRPIIIAWIKKDCASKRARLKCGDIEVEAKNSADALRLLESLAELRKDSVC